ncbi:MAG: alpha/beta hydrolase [Candidatus Zixiibacteriota bacterium]|jgi:pimeloyl-ACP methyl ester carboxylesterase
MPTVSPIFKSPKAEARVLAAYDAAMKLWPIPYETRDVPTRYGSTHVIVSGPADAPPLVLLHCALMTSAIWSPIIGDLSRNYRTYAVDVIGDVGRTVPTNPPATERDLANWLADVCDELGIEETRLLAWSFGRFVGTNFARHEPGRVSKLALLAPYATFVKGGVGFLLGFIPFLIPTRATVRLFEKALCHKPDFGFEEHSEILYERFRSAKLVFKVPPRVFEDDEFAALRTPALLLVGEQEFLYNGKAAVERANRVLPNGEAELIPECNHAVVSDQTELVSTRILEFLDK